MKTWGLETFWVMHYKWTREEFKSYPSNSQLRVVWWSGKRACIICYWIVWGFYGHQEERIFCVHFVTCILCVWGEMRGTANTVNQIGWSKPCSGLGGWLSLNAYHINMDSQHPYKSQVWCICKPRARDRQRQAEPIGHWSISLASQWALGSVRDHVSKHKAEN